MNVSATTEIRIIGSTLIVSILTQQLHQIPQHRCWIFFDNKDDEADINNVKCPNKIFWYLGKNTPLSERQVLGKPLLGPNLHNVGIETNQLRLNGWI